MPPPVPIFSEKMDDKQVIYFMWPYVQAYRDLLNLYRIFSWDKITDCESNNT